MEKERELIKNTGYVGVPVAFEAVRIEKKYLALKKEITLLENNGVLQTQSLNMKITQKKNLLGMVY